MRSSSIEPKPADEDAETAGLDLMSLLVNPVTRGVLRRRVDEGLEPASIAVDARTQTLETTQDGFCETAGASICRSSSRTRAPVGVDDRRGLPVCRLASPGRRGAQTQNVKGVLSTDCKAVGELEGIEKPQLPARPGRASGAGGRGAGAAAAARR